MKRFVEISLVAAAAVFLSACSATKDPSSLPVERPQVPHVKIGVIIPLTGVAAAYGEEMKRILDYEAEEINAKSAQNGYEVELAYEDGKCEGGAASAAFQKLTDADGIKIIIGGFCSSETLAIAPLLDVKKDVLVFSPVSSNPDIEGKSPRLFSLSYNDNVIGEGIARELGKFKTVAMISERNEYNQGLHDVAVRLLEKDSPSTRIVLDEWFPKGSNDFRNQLEKLKNSNADAVFLNPNGGTTPEALLRQIAELKNWKPQFVSQIAYMNADVRAKAPEAIEGIVIIDTPTVTSPEFLAYQDRIAVKKGPLKNMGGYFTESTIDSLHILLELAKRHDGNVEKMRNSLSTETFRGWLGEIRFDGHSFVQGIPSARFVVRNGKLEASDQ
jgi:branched-chain amino acid transport system substrate-binding protein